MALASRVPSVQVQHGLLLRRAYYYFRAAVGVLHRLQLRVPRFPARLVRRTLPARVADKVPRSSQLHPGGATQLVRTLLRDVRPSLQQDLRAAAAPRPERSRPRRHLRKQKKAL